MTQVQIDDLRKNPETGVLERWNGQYWERVDGVSNLPSKKNSHTKEGTKPTVPIGSAESPYPIKNGEDLQNIITGKRGICYVLANDIDLSGYDNWNLEFRNKSFHGVLDGAGYKITGLKCISTSISLGLFKYNSGVIKNLIIEDATLISEDEDVLYAGIIAASNSGEIIDCKVSGTITGISRNMGGIAGKNFGTISGSLSSAQLSGNVRYMGGIVGVNSGTISENSFTGSLSGDARNMGGIAGENWKFISNSSSSGHLSGTAEYMGGIAGKNWKIISNSSSSSNLSGTAKYLGGIAGENSGTISHSSASGILSGKVRLIGGVAGSNSKVIENCNSTVEVTYL